MSWKGWSPAPLPGSFMLISILGFLISVILILPKSLNWGIAFAIVFVMMFIASLISIAKSQVQIDDFTGRVRKR